MNPKISGITTLVAIIYALASLISIVKAQQPEAEPRYKPRYLLRAFTASGADSNDFDINDYDNPYSVGDPHYNLSVLYIRNVKNKKRLWEFLVGYTRKMQFELQMASDKKHAVLFFTDSGRLQALWWLHLPEGKPPAKWIDSDKFEELALKACGKVESGWVPKTFAWLWFDFLDWDAQGRCRLKWNYRVSHEEVMTPTTQG